VLDAGLVPALLALVEPDERGDPESPLRWTTKSLRNFAAPVRACVIRVFWSDSSRRSSFRMNVVRRSLISSASALGPVNPNSVSSA
jgi:hypothetical protein